MKTNYFFIEHPQGRIWCAHDLSDDGGCDRPLVVVTPGYERTARDSLMLSAYLVLNGFDVLRFDARNSVGQSTGNITKFTLSSLTDDIRAVLNHAVTLEYSKPNAVLAVSLSARALARCLTSATVAKNVFAVVSIVGVVNTRQTVSAITGEDNFAGYIAGRRYGVRRLITHEIDWDHFIEDAIDQRFDTFENCLEDATRTEVPLWVSITTEQDEWVDTQEAESFLDALAVKDVRRITIAGASHKIWKNPRVARLSMEEVVRALRQHYFNPTTDTPVIQPDVTDIIQKNRAERKAADLDVWNSVGAYPLNKRRRLHVN